MNFKIGDKIRCKKEYFNLKVDHKYEIIYACDTYINVEYEIKKLNVPYTVNWYSFRCIKSDDAYNYFYDYFYTKQEDRKEKLKILSNE